jgi:hypothetical protein
MDGKKVRAGLRLTRELNAEYAGLAKGIGITKNALYIEALRFYADYLKQKRARGA